MIAHLALALLTAMGQTAPHPTAHCRPAMVYQARTIAIAPSMDKVAFGYDEYRKSNGKDCFVPYAAIHIGTKEEHRLSLDGMGGVVSCAFSPDSSHVAFGGCDGTLWLCSAWTGQTIWKQRLGTNEVRSLAFSPDGGMLAIGQSGSKGRAVQCCLATNGTPVWQYRMGGWHAIESVQFLPDSRQLVAAGSHELKATALLIDLNKGAVIDIWQWLAPLERKLVNQPDGAASVKAASCSSSGRIVACGTNNGAVAVFDLRSHRACKALYPTPYYGNGVTGLALSPDGQRVACTFHRGFEYRSENPPAIRVIELGEQPRAQVRDFSIGEPLVAFGFSFDNKSLLALGKSGKERYFPLN